MANNNSAPKNRGAANPKPNNVENNSKGMEPNQMSTPKMEAKGELYKFVHKNKYQYIPAPTYKDAGIQFRNGLFETSDKRIADYVSNFDGVICLSDNMEE